MIRFLAVLALLLGVGVAHAQTANQVVPGTSGSVGCSAYSPCFTPFNGAITQTTVTCGSSSTAVLSANTAAAFIVVHVPTGASNPVWFNFAGAAAVAAPPSEDVAAGGTKLWSAASTFLPTAAISCIVSTGSQAITVEYK